jgi:hypothetical protein
MRNNAHLVEMEFLDYSVTINVYVAQVISMMAHYNANNVTFHVILALLQIQLLIVFLVMNYMKKEYWMFHKESAFAKLGIMKIIRFV